MSPRHGQRGDRESILKPKPGRHACRCHNCNEAERGEVDWLERLQHDDGNCKRATQSVIAAIDRIQAEFGAITESCANKVQVRETFECLAG